MFFTVEMALPYIPTWQGLKDPCRNISHTSLRPIESYIFSIWSPSEREPTITLLFDIWILCPVSVIVFCKLSLTYSDTDILYKTHSSYYVLCFLLECCHCTFVICYFFDHSFRKRLDLQV